HSPPCRPDPPHRPDRQARCAQVRGRHGALGRGYRWQLSCQNSATPVLVVLHRAGAAAHHTNGLDQSSLLAPPVMIVTEVPFFTVVPAAGEVLATSWRGEPWVPLTTSPAASSASAASTTVMPDTSGTTTVGGPLDTPTETVEPRGTCSPAA